MRDPGWALGRRGATLIELMVVLVVSGILMTGALSIFLIFARVAEEQEAVRDAQTELHRSVELLLNLVRNAAEVHDSSNGSRLALSGPRSEPLCGSETCWLEASGPGLVARPPDGESGETRLIAPAVTGFEVTFGLDTLGIGTVDSFSSEAPVELAPDVLAVRLRLFVDARSGRGRFLGETEVTAVIREKVFDRLELEG